MAVYADHSSVAPRSVRDVIATLTEGTPVASPYYNDQRDVVPVTWVIAAP